MWAIGCKNFEHFHASSARKSFPVFILIKKGGARCCLPLCFLLRKQSESPRRTIPVFSPQFFLDVTSTATHFLFALLPRFSSSLPPWSLPRFSCCRGKRKNQTCVGVYSIAYCTVQYVSSTISFSRKKNILPPTAMSFHCIRFFPWRTSPKLNFQIGQPIV